MGSTAESRFNREPREQDFGKNRSHQFLIIQDSVFFCLCLRSEFVCFRTENKTEEEGVSVFECFGEEEETERRR